MKSANIIRSDMTNYRRHVFPPLRVESDSGLNLADDGAPNFEQGFQQGLETGHAEGNELGYQQGLATGQHEGHNIGLTKGIAEGQVQGAQLFKDAVAQLSTLQQKVDELSRHKLVAQQTLISELVAQVSRQVIRAELTLNPKQVLTLVEEAMQAFADDVDKVRIFLNSEDKQRLESLGVNELNGWLLETDEQLACGDCYIRSTEKEISVDTEERFQQCMEGVRQSMS